MLERMETNQRVFPEVEAAAILGDVLSALRCLHRRAPLLASPAPATAALPRRRGFRGTRTLAVRAQRTPWPNAARRPAGPRRAYRPCTGAGPSPWLAPPPPPPSHARQS